MAIATWDYAQDENGNPTDGALMLVTPGTGVPAIKCGPGGIQIGQFTFANLVRRHQITFGQFETSRYIDNLFGQPGNPLPTSLDKWTVNVTPIGFTGTPNELSFVPYNVGKSHASNGKITLSILRYPDSGNTVTYEVTVIREP